MEKILDWKPDLLGAGFKNVHFDIAPDFEENLRGTVIKHVPEEDPQALPTLEKPLPKFAFLAVHGWNDYFYQIDLARHISAMGGVFYAVDLRRYGRSHAEGQVWGYIADIKDYDVEISKTKEIIFNDLGQEVPIILYGHSTGGLSTSIWANDHANEIAGLVLNSPWLGGPFSVTKQNLIKPFMWLLAKIRPLGIIPISDSGFYQRTLKGDHLKLGDFPEEEDPANDQFFTTGWYPDSRYRHYPTFPVRFGWVNAIINAHKAIQKGLNIKAPVIVFTSTKSFTGEEWHLDHLSSDSVLNVETIWKYAPNLGKNVAVKKIKHGLHDVMFSRASARNTVYENIYSWLADILK